MGNFRTFLRGILLPLVLIMALYGVCYGEEKYNSFINGKYVYYLVQKYFPKEYYQFLRKAKETDILIYVENKTFKEALFSIPTIFHETAHGFTVDTNSLTKEVTDRTEQNQTIRYHYDYRFPVEPERGIPVKYFKTFPVAEIDPFAPLEVKQLFRYNTYVTDLTYRVANNTGILWHLDEMNAYNFSFRTGLMLFDAIQGEYGFESPDIWVEYLGHISSERYAVGEFKTFIGSYLQVAKKDHPESFQRITGDPRIKELFTYLETDDELHARQYDAMIQTIKAKLGSKIEFREEYVYPASKGDGKARTGWGQGNQMVQKILAILGKEEYKILDVLR